MKTVRLCFRVAMDAFYRFNADDGWAIASHIALSILMSMFPFLILVTAIAGFVGSTDLADEVARIIIAAWPREVSEGIAVQIHSVLTTARGDVLTIGAIFAIYFASSGVESLRIGLNRAYGLVDPRPWWLCRLESIGYVLIAAIGLLTLSFLVVLGPLAYRAALYYLPWLDPLENHYDIGRIVIATVLLTTSLSILHMWLPAGRRPIYAVWPGIVATLALMARLRLRVRPLSEQFFLRLRDLLRRSCIGDDRAGVSLFHRLDFHLWRRTQRRDHPRTRRR